MTDLDCKQTEKLIPQFLKDELDKYWMGEKPEDLSKKFRDKTIVEGVEFDVEDENSKGTRSENKE